MKLFLPLLILVIGTTTFAQGSPIATTVEATIDANLTSVFDFIVAENVLPKVLFRYGPTPGVIGTTVLQNPLWNLPGSSRIVHFDDGNSTFETILGFDSPYHFSYQSTNYTGLFGAIIDVAHGEWWFQEDSGRTHLIWTYSFTGKSRLARALLAKRIVPHEFHQYMLNALSRIKEAVEQKRQGVNP